MCETLIRLGGVGGAASARAVWGRGPKRQTWGRRNGAGAKRRRSEAHAEPGELTLKTSHTQIGDGSGEWLGTVTARGRCAAFAITRITILH
jgi:hypothetical protein